MITRRDFIKGMGALALCVSLPMAAGATVTPRIGYYGSLQHMADSLSESDHMETIAKVLNSTNEIMRDVQWDLTGTMTIPHDGTRYKLKYTVHPDRTDAEIVGEE